MESEAVEPYDSYEDCTGESAEPPSGVDPDGNPAERVLVDRVDGKTKRFSTWNVGGWSELQVKRGRYLHELLRKRGVVPHDPPLLTLELGAYVGAVDELYGEQLKELATTLEIENAYGYSYEPAEDETQAGRLRAAECEVKELIETLKRVEAQRLAYSKRIDELAAERDALQHVISGRAAIAEAEPAFARVEQTLEHRG